MEQDDLASELAAAAPKRYVTRTTRWLGAGALLVAGFIGGVQVQKSYGEPAAAATPNRPGFPQVGTRPSTAPASGTTGTIKLVDGSTIYVQTASGELVTIKVNGQTKVAVASAGKLADLKAGDPVTVQGSTGADGTVTATEVTETAK